MVRYARKTNPGVRHGTVKKKHRTDLSPHYFNHDQDTPIIDRLRPGEGYRHLIRKPDLERFIQLLPDWAELSKGLNAVILAPGEPNLQGYYYRKVVAICAWEREITGEYSIDFVDEHRSIIDRLGVRIEKRVEESLFLHWTEGTARAFQLLHIFPHELGHHHDRMTTKLQRSCGRGEDYAEAYANEYSEKIWAAYERSFGW